MTMTTNKPAPDTPAQDAPPPRIYLIRGTNNRLGKKWYTPNVNVEADEHYIEYILRSTHDAETERLREALRGAKEYIVSLLGDCDPDCDCIIHQIDAALGKEKD